jgi:hypothetical protein
VFLYRVGLKTLLVNCNFLSYIFFIFICEKIPRIFKITDLLNNLIAYINFAKNEILSLKSHYFVILS